MDRQIKKENNMKTDTKIHLLKKERMWYSRSRDTEPKSSANDEIIDAIRLVLAGGIFVPSALFSIHSGQDADESPMSNVNAQSKRTIALLTDRQKEVLKLIAQGKTNKDIALFLDLSANTVKVHVTAVLQILHVTNRTEAVVMAQQLGLIE